MPYVDNMNLNYNYDIQLAPKLVDWSHTYMLVQSNLSCQTASNCEYLQTLAAAAAMTFVVFAITYCTTCVQTVVRHTFKCLALLPHGTF